MREWPKSLWSGGYAVGILGQVPDIQETFCGDELGVAVAKTKLRAIGAVVVSRVGPVVMLGGVSTCCNVIGIRDQHYLRCAWLRAFRSCVSAKGVCGDGLFGFFAERKCSKDFVAGAKIFAA